jgi:PAT family beta-lactamase induction signal transducer AmpG
MSLLMNKTERAVVLSALFFAQGVPRGFMAIAMISYLAERGISDAQAGRLSAVILLPWALRLAWAPLLDAISFRSMGRRRPLIILAELIMGISLLSLLIIGDPAHSLTLLSCLFFVHNCSAALQDVATEALAIDILPPSELGTMNGLMLGSKMMGRGMGAAGLAYIMKHSGFQSAIFVQFGVLITIMCFPLLIVERPGERRFPWSYAGVSAKSPDIITTNILVVLKNLVLTFRQKAAASLFLFGIIASIGEEIVDLITKPFYIKALGWTFVEYSTVSGYSIVTAVLGTLAGGWFADRIGCRATMIMGTGTCGLLAIAFAISPKLWVLASTFLIVTPALVGFSGVAFFALAYALPEEPGCDQMPLRSR